MIQLLRLLIILSLCTGCGEKRMQLKQEYAVPVDTTFILNKDTTMKGVLQNLSAWVIRYPERSFSEEQIKSKWLGNPPATADEIDQAEKRLGIKFPDDYREFLGICNGFNMQSWTDPAFHPVEKIDYLKNVDAQLIRIWKETGNVSEAKMLERSLIIGGINEEQYFLLIPPPAGETVWTYWKFAAWIPGPSEFAGIYDYWRWLLKFEMEYSDD